MSRINFSSNNKLLLYCLVVFACILAILWLIVSLHLFSVSTSSLQQQHNDESEAVNNNSKNNDKNNIINIRRKNPLVRHHFTEANKKNHEGGDDSGDETRHEQSTHKKKNINKKKKKHDQKGETGTHRIRHAGKKSSEEEKQPNHHNGNNKIDESKSEFLNEPFFDLFQGATIQELAEMNHEEFLQKTFAKIEHSPLLEQNHGKLPALLLLQQPSTVNSSSSLTSTTKHDEKVIPNKKLPFAPLAYALIISNEDFVDGALVLGASLLLNSQLLQTGKAELVLIVTNDRIGDDSKRRLKEVGFTVIVSVPSLARFVPNAALKDTFDKIFMFALVMFKRVVFMDADMLNVKSADDLFHLQLVPASSSKKDDDDGDDSANNELWVRAIGFRGDRRRTGDGDYFQTGMILFQPGTRSFARVLNRFAKNIPPRGRMYNIGMNGRDGVLIRDVFQSNFTEVSNKYSRNMNPRLHIPDEVVSLHFRGRHKMWFDRQWKNADPELGKKEFGFNYVAWWNLYEKLHKSSRDYLLAAAAAAAASSNKKLNNNNNNKENNKENDDDANGKPYGGTQAREGVSSLTHVWMMRHTSREYVQLLHDVEEQRMRLSYYYDDVESEKQKKKEEEQSSSSSSLMKLVAGKPGQSCDQVCAENNNQKCIPAALNFTQLNNCSVLSKFFGGCPDGCEMGVYWRPHPGKEFPGLDMRFSGAKKNNNKQRKNKQQQQQKLCVFNFRHDDRCFPTCDASNETTARLCPCTTKSGMTKEEIGKMKPVALREGDEGY